MNVVNESTQFLELRELNQMSLVKPFYFWQVHAVLSLWYVVG